MSATSPSPSPKGCHSHKQAEGRDVFSHQKGQSFLAASLTPYRAGLRACSLTGYKAPWESKSSGVSASSRGPRPKGESGMGLPGGQSTAHPNLRQTPPEHSAITLPSLTYYFPQISSSLVYPKYLLGGNFYIPTINAKPLLGSFFQTMLK